MSDPREIIASMILARTWDWDDTVAVYIPRKLHDELQATAAEFVKTLPGSLVASGKGVDVRNTQHAVSVGVAWQVAHMAVRVMNHGSFRRALDGLGAALRDVIASALSGEGHDCDRCGFREDCKNNECGAREGGDEASPLN